MSICKAVTWVEFSQFDLYCQISEILFWSLTYKTYMKMYMRPTVYEWFVHILILKVSILWCVFRYQRVNASLRIWWEIKILVGITVGLPHARQKRLAPRLQPARTWLLWMTQPVVTSLLLIQSSRSPAKVSWAFQTQSTCWHQSSSRITTWRSLLPTGWWITAKRGGSGYPTSKMRRCNVQLTSWHSIHLNVSV